MTAALYPESFQYSPQTPDDAAEGQAESNWRGCVALARQVIQSAFDDIVSDKTEPRERVNAYKFLKCKGWCAGRGRFFLSAIGRSHPFTAAEIRAYVKAAKEIKNNRRAQNAVIMPEDNEEGEDE